MTRIPMCFVVVAGLATAAAAQDRILIRQFGTSAFDSADGLCPDGTGGAFVAGQTQGSVGWPNAGGFDAWLARYDAAGNRIWARQLGTAADDQVRGFCPDGVGGIFVSGYSRGALGGPNAGGQDAWLARYDGAGNQLWIRQFGTGADDTVIVVCSDGTGGAFVAGDTSGNLAGAGAGGIDAWLARYDSAGNRTWIQQFGTISLDRSSAICPDGAGGAFLSGFTGGSLGGPIAGGTDAWLARYDGAGTRAWIRQFGTGGDENARALCPDSAGGTFVAGLSTGSLGGPNAGNADVWLSRYDSAGTLTWIRQFGTNARDDAYAICPDGAGGTFVAGDTVGSLGGPASGSDDAWLARYDNAGARIWIRQFGTGGSETAYGLSPDGAGGAFVAGRTQGSLGGPGAGGFDAWLARYDRDCGGDFNRDGQVDFFDYLDFVGAFDIGC